MIDGSRRPEAVATLQEKIPGAYRDLEQVRSTLEKHFGELQDIEFTVENSRLFLLQTRPGPCAGPAAVRLAVEMAREKLITWSEAVARVPVERLAGLCSTCAHAPRRLEELPRAGCPLRLGRPHAALANGSRSWIANETNLKQLLGWADKLRRLQVRVEAERAGCEIKQAIAQGAQGIGVWRLEKWIFSRAALSDLPRTEKPILPAEAGPSGHALLAALRRDLLEIFRTLHGLPISLCLLDPGRLERSRSGPGAMKTEPEAGAWQVRAIFEAASEAQREGLRVRPEILLPHVSFCPELAREVQQVRDVAARVARENHTRFHFLIGAMIETPRACLVAEALAREIDCFFFSLPDLARATLGQARLPCAGFSTADPSPLPSSTALDMGGNFDRSGTGELLRLACERGRRSRPDLKLGCSLAGGDDFETVHFAEELGFNHITAPLRYLGAVRLVAAQAALESTVK